MFAREFEVNKLQRQDKRLNHLFILPILALLKCIAIRAPEIFLASFLGCLLVHLHTWLWEIC